MGPYLAPHGRPRTSGAPKRTFWSQNEPFWGPKNARNGPFQACNEKNRIDGCDGTEISGVLPLGIVRIAEKTAPLRPIFAENQFSPANEAVLMGLVVRKCHFDVTACAEARRLAQRAERSLRDLSALWASRRASRAGWINRHLICCRRLPFATPSEKRPLTKTAVTL